jgi:pilus assembly protein CpaE
MLFGTASNNGQMISDVGPQSKCAEGLTHLASLFAGAAVQAKAKPKSLFAKFLPKKAVK